ncbi:carbohydrate kinase family protein [Prochlorococcus marinus]|uniref:carbohydrate kinase family protein n=1 Tax=Prochlorococcus marinus TaxID=1219 RepID=UPI0022B3F107|nr:carbohydrate kinase [Prochlorococcus marinus]
MNSPNVICLGEALVDRLGPLGGGLETLNSHHDYLGGAPANVACGLAKLGFNVGFIGCVGDDSIGTQFQDLFISCGVNISALQIHETLLTRVVLVKRDSNGERSFGGFKGNKKNMFADQALNLKNLQSKWPALSINANWLVMGTILLAGDNSREVVEWIIDQSVQQGIQIAIDLNWRPTFWDQTLSPESGPSNQFSSLIEPFLARASLIKLAKEEAIWFFNNDDPVFISGSLPQRPSVIITDGANPICWKIGSYHGTTEPLAPSLVVDTTGAGDAFMAGMLSQVLINSLNPITNNLAEQMVKFSAACGALVCKGSGAIDPQPHYPEVEKFLSLG